MATDDIPLAANQARAFLRSMCCGLALVGVPAPGDGERGPQADSRRLMALLAAHERFALALAAEKRQAEFAEVARPGLRIVRDPGVPVDGAHRLPLALVPLAELPSRAAELLGEIYESEHGKTL